MRDIWIYYLIGGVTAAATIMLIGNGGLIIWAVFTPVGIWIANRI